ncbi:hypothetical protein II9_05574 [Bacillus cereus MSX-D12]|nr:hypothetical protein II9_05574 [Bacillus cereus MSX-D12]
MLHATGEIVGTVIIFLGVLFYIFMQFLFKGTKIFFFNMRRFKNEDFKR